MKYLTLLLFAIAIHRACSCVGGFEDLINPPDSGEIDQASGEIANYDPDYASGEYPDGSTKGPTTDESTDPGESTEEPETEEPKRSTVDPLLKELCEAGTAEERLRCVKRMLDKQNAWLDKLKRAEPEGLNQALPSPK